MAKLLDFDSIKRDYPILDVAVALGLTNLKSEKGGSSYRGDCPYCEYKDTFVITPKPPSKEHGLSGCHRCGHSANCIQLVMNIKKLKVLDAAQWIVDHFENSTAQKGTVQKSTVLTESAPNKGAFQGGVKPEGFPPLTYLESDHETVMQAGFATEFAAKLGIGYAPKGILRGLVAIPIRDESGTLLGYMGISEEPKLPASFTPNGDRVVSLDKKRAS